ncbi:hypothetical protein ACIO3O_08345 [Streptomyces sp. NPDC087440]|uniref:hypothetical protein n=1 Tax=Streptomyces sp. NPDC087440 TaxID=3365790 RepID=UPI003828FF85
MSTHSFIARPTETGYDGIYVHFDGVPSHQLPLLLSAFNYRFKADLEAMTRHLVDDVSVGWDELGTDLLDDAPPALVAALTGGEQWPSRSLDHLKTLDGSPPVRMVVNDATAVAQDMKWGYVLHPHGIETISVDYADRGPVVSWRTAPHTVFSDHPALWASPQFAPVVTSRRTTPPSTTPAAAPTATAATPRTSAHR